MRVFEPIIQCPICDTVLCRSMNKKNFWNYKRHFDEHMLCHGYTFWRIDCYYGYGQRDYFIEYIHVYFIDAKHPSIKIDYGCKYDFSYLKAQSVSDFFEHVDKEAYLGTIDDVDRKIYEMWLIYPRKPIKEIAEETNCCIKRVKGVIAQTHVAIQDGLLEEMVEDVF